MLKLKIKNKPQQREEGIDKRYLASKFIKLTNDLLSEGNVEVFSTKRNKKAFAKINSIVEPLIGYSTLFDIVEGGNGDLYIRVKLEVQEGKTKVSRDYLWTKDTEEVVLSLSETLELLEIQGFEVLDTKPPRVSQHQIAGNKALDNILELVRAAKLEEDKDTKV